MRLLAICEGEKFHVSAGTGNKDLAWLAQTIAFIYGRKRHPTYNYTAVLLRNSAGDAPHPRCRIKQAFTQEDEEVHVQVRKVGVELDEEQQEWYDRAFGKMRYRMKCRFYFAFEKRSFYDKYPDAKVLGFTILVKLKRFPETLADYTAKDSKDEEELTMEARFDAKEFTDYYVERDFPFGEITTELRVVYKMKSGGEEEPIKKSLGAKEPGFTFDLTPNPMSEKQMVDLEISEIEKQAEQIDLKPEKEVERDEPLGHCPYTIETLWKIFDWSWLTVMLKNDTSQDVVMKYLSGELDKIYEIFFHFSQFHIQDLSNKDEISITWQEVFLILKFFELIPTGSSLRNFIIAYNKEQNAFSTVEDTLSIENPVHFPEFVFILLRAISYVKNNPSDIDDDKQSLSSENTNKTIFETKLNRMIEIHLNDEELTDFQRHMLFSAELIELLREKSPILKQTFIEKLSNTLQPSENKFYLLKEEISKIIDDIGFLGENIEQIVDTCFLEVTPGEKYDEFEGLYYYEYLQALQWLSLVFIQKKDENVDPNEEDIEVNDETLIEKLGFFVERLEKIEEYEEEENA